MKNLNLIIAVTGIAITGCTAIYFIFGAIGLVPTFVDLFGYEGLRIPASLTIGGLLLAAIGFNKF